MFLPMSCSKKIFFFFENAALEEFLIQGDGFPSGGMGHP